MNDSRADGLDKLIAPLRVAPGSSVKLERDHDPAYTAGWLEHREGEQHLRLTVELLAVPGRLAAQSSHGVLVVLQALDAAGEDGTIRHVMSGVNPQGVAVHSFKVPSGRSWWITSCGATRPGSRTQPDRRSCRPPLQSPSIRSFQAACTAVP